MRISDWSSDVCSSDLGKTWLGYDHELETSLITNQMIHAKESRLATANNESGRMLFSNRESYANQLEAQAFTNLNKVTTSGLHGVSGTSFNDAAPAFKGLRERSEENTSELQSLMRLSYAV